MKVVCFAKQKEKDSKIFCYPFIVPKKSLRATPLKGAVFFNKQCVKSCPIWAAFCAFILQRGCIFNFRVLGYIERNFYLLCGPLAKKLCNRIVKGLQNAKKVRDI